MLQTIHLAFVKFDFVISDGFRTWWLLISVCILISMTVLSQITYPIKYSIVLHTVSSQGSKVKNPGGHWIWQAGMMLVAGMKVFDFLLVHKEFTDVSESWANIGLLISLIATIAMFMVGVVSEDSWNTHLVFANIAFLGYYILAHVDLGLLVRKDSLYLASLLNTFFLVCLYILFNLAFLGMIVSFLIKDKGWDNFFVKFLRFPLWEWFYFVAVIVWSVYITRVASFL